MLTNAPLSPSHVAPSLLGYYYTMNNTELECSNNTRDLGLMIQSDLLWNTHIKTIVAKGLRNHWMVVRNSGYSVDSQVKRQCYVAIVHPTMEYATHVWFPQTKKNLESIERVQRVATNFIADNKAFGDPQHINYKSKLTQLGLLPLSYRREIMDLDLTFKIIYDLLNHDLSRLIHIFADTRQDMAGVITRRGENRLFHCERFSRTETSKNWFSGRIPVVWNTLPDDVRLKMPGQGLNPLSAFKTAVNQFYKAKVITSFDDENPCSWLTGCRCRSCRNS